MLYSASLAAIFLPMPHSSPIGICSSVRGISSSRMMVSPSGFFISLASFASSLLGAMPMEQVMPKRALILDLIR